MAKRVCCNCRKDFGECVGNDDTYTICEDCIRLLYPDIAEKVLEKIKNKKMEDEKNGKKI